MPTPRRRFPKWLVWVAGSLVLVGSLLALSWNRWDPEFRGFARRTLETQLAGLLAGEVHIDRVDSLHLGGIVAIGVTVLDPLKRPVLHADRLELDMNLFELLQNRLRFTRGHMVGTRIRAIASEAAAVTLFDALIPKSAGAPAPPDAEPLHLSGVLREHPHRAWRALWQCAGTRRHPRRATRCARSHSGQRHLPGRCHQREGSVRRAFCPALRYRERHHRSTHRAPAHQDAWRGPA